MATLCFGGSFNPIHHGHLICARAVAEAVASAQVILIPSSKPPHKPDSPDIAPGHHRLAMCQLATSKDPLFTVNEIELHRTGPSYTFDTVQALSAQGHVKVQWLIGADMVAILPTWHRAQELIHEVEFLLMARPGWSFDFDRLPPEFRHLRHSVIPAPFIDISATQIRARIRRNEPITYLTPAPVVEYIHHHRLYTTP